MVAVLRYQHVREQARTGKPARNRSLRRGTLSDAATLCASELRPNMADHLEVRGHVLKHFADILAETLELTAAALAAARWRMHDVLARQLWRQCLAHGLDAFGLFFGNGGCGGRRDLSLASFEFFQRELELRDLRIELLGRSSEAHTLQAQQLDPELLDQHIALQQLLERRVELFFLGCNLRVLLDQQ